MLDKTLITKTGAALFGVVVFYGFIYMLSNSVYATRPATAVLVDDKGKAVLAVPAAPAAAAPAAEAAPVEAAAEPAAPALPPTVEIDLATITGDAKAGEAIFIKNCKTCHKVDGKNAVGPHLNGVVGRATATAEAFKYSVAMKAHTGHWTAERLDVYLTNPKAEVPGTRMSFAGLKDAKDRADVIAYLHSKGE